MFEELQKVDPAMLELVHLETERKETSLELIPSENVVSKAVMEVVGSVLTDKYCEGYPGARYYGGCVHYDTIENLARERAKKIFSTEQNNLEYVNVQPHSGSNANMAVYYSLLKPGDTVLGPRLDHGGHLTHGSPVNFSGKYFNIVAYGVNPETELFETSEIRRLALEHKPKMIISGATAYSRVFDWKALSEIAKEVGAVLMADIAHYAGLIVGGAYPSPVGYADVITTTTHKTLRGPRGGMIMTNSEKISKAVDKMIFPGIQGGPLMHQVAGKAVAFLEASKPEFKTYAHQILKNAQTLADCLTKNGIRIVTGGTDSHLMVLDLRGKKATGADFETALGKVGITVNKNTVPNDPAPPKITSGVRLGTPAITTRGFKEGEMFEVADLITQALENFENETKLKDVRIKVEQLCRRFPLYKV